MTFFQAPLVPSVLLLVRPQETLPQTCSLPWTDHAPPSSAANTEASGPNGLSSYCPLSSANLPKAVGTCCLLLHFLTDVPMFSHPTKFTCKHVAVATATSYSIAEQRAKYSFPKPAESLVGGAGSWQMPPSRKKHGSPDNSPSSDHTSLDLPVPCHTTDHHQTENFPVFSPPAYMILVSLPQTLFSACTPTTGRDLWSSRVFLYAVPSSIPFTFGFAISINTKPKPTSPTAHWRLHSNSV